MRFRTNDEIQKHLAAQRTSGKSIAAYCRLENISQNTFFNWRRRFPEPVVNGPAIPFLKLPFASPGPERLDVTLPNGTKISTPVSFDLHLMREVVRLLAPLRPRQ
jgi:transposase-like protein